MSNKHNYEKIRFTVSSPEVNGNLPWKLEAKMRGRQNFKELIPWHSSPKEYSDLAMVLHCVKSLANASQFLTDAREGLRKFVEFLFNEIPDTVPWELIIAPEAQSILSRFEVA